ncbi:hypothetical protein CAEBREN_17353 [Caenorhabditis brenneri]|uniref:Protein kinase domain-containing protein n=1 Tax=Caenorhabditis brenneri TaxID=135651 RepID=G0N478_CAEBE|nr:hypothetical protein CAEBREN_17353 [Caenorhabditis brenneri]
MAYFQVSASISFSAFPASNAFGLVRSLNCQALSSFKMDDFHLNSGITFKSYIVKELIGQGNYGKVYLMSKQENPNELVALKVQRQFRNPIPFETEVQVLSSLPESCHFSTMICHGTTANIYNYIIMTHCGDTLFKMLKRTDDFCFSLENTLRIGCQLFDLVRLFHSFGWLHRDLHWGNVTINTDAHGRLKMGMIDYGLCIPLNGPPIAQVISRWHTSLYVTLGHPYTEIDDFVSVVFLLMRCLDLEPFGRRVLLIEAKKAQFHSSPERLLCEKYHWIWKLYNLVESQRYTGIDINAVKTYIRSVDRNFDPSSDISYTVRKGLVVID